MGKHVNHAGSRALTMLVVALGICAFVGTAEAGRRPFLWVYDTEVLPERGVELEQWITQRVMRTPADANDVWWGAILGITDNVELALPMQWTHWQKADSVKFEWYGAELRLRLASADKLEAGPVVPLLRVAVHHQLRAPHAFRIESNAIVSWDPTEDLHATADVGVQVLHDVTDVLATWAVGATYHLGKEVKLGGEFFGEVFVKDPTPAARKSFFMFGPVAAWTHGRFWATFGALGNPGSAGPRMMPRLVWGISL